jgi:hypothetical protein
MDVGLQRAADSGLRAHVEKTDVNCVSPERLLRGRLLPSCLRQDDAKVDAPVLMSALHPEALRHHAVEPGIKTTAELVPFAINQHLVFV